MLEIQTNLSEVDFVDLLHPAKSYLLHMHKTHGKSLYVYLVQSPIFNYLTTAKFTR